jgi:hypothetical protein
MAGEHLSRLARSCGTSGDAGFAPVVAQKSANCFKLSRRHNRSLHRAALTAAGRNCPPARYRRLSSTQVPETGWLLRAIDGKNEEIGNDIGSGILHPLIIERNTDQRLESQ